METGRHPFEVCFADSAIRPFLAELRERGLIQSGAEHLAADSRVRAPRALARLSALIQGAGEGAEDTALAAVLRVRRGQLGVLHYLADTAATLGDAWRVLVRYSRLVDETAQFTLSRDASMARLELGSVLEASRQTSDFRVALIAARSRDWLDARAPLEAQFSYPRPATLALHDSVLRNVMLRFGARCDALLVPVAALELPLHSSNPELHLVLQDCAEDLLSKVPSLQSLQALVRSRIHEHFQREKPTAAKVAQTLGMSRRSLVRYLGAQGCSFSQMLTETRHDEAKRLLVCTELPIAEIAARLGYAGLSAFSRAFTRWERCSPARYRAASRERHA